MSEMICALKKNGSSGGTSEILFYTLTGYSTVTIGDKKSYTFDFSSKFKRVDKFSLTYYWTNAATTIVITPEGIIYKCTKNTFQYTNGISYNPPVTTADSWVRYTSHTANTFTIYHDGGGYTGYFVVDWVLGELV